MRYEIFSTRTKFLSKEQKGFSLTALRENGKKDFNLFRRTKALGIEERNAKSGHSESPTVRERPKAKYIKFNINYQKQLDK